MSIIGKMMHILLFINKILSPGEKFIRSHKQGIGYFLVALSFFSFPLIFIESSVKTLGEQALNLLTLILFLPILSRVLGITLATALMPLRKELGILMGTLAFVHAGSFILPYPDFFVSKEFWWQHEFISYLTFGFLGLLCTLPLLVTSNNYSIKKLGKFWKVLHRLVYVLFVFVVLHVVVLKFVIYGEVEYGQILLLIIYLGGKYLEWKGVKFINTSSYPRGQKWICPPCGHIYDPEIGDPESGIKPGTEFRDLPNNWICPDCGAKKSDFIPYTEEQREATVVAITLLNDTTIELQIELPKAQTFIPGQYMKFHWSDKEGDFTRQYSIAEKKGNIYTFTIKLSVGSRSSNLIKSLQVGQKVHVGGIFGSFTLKDTKNPKIFIATGTGLAPIYQMLLSLSDDIQKSLYFSVATEAELFYVEKLRRIKNLDLHIHVTREEVEGYEKGRVNITSIETSRDTEWYLCGNPKMVADTKEKLGERGIQHVYSEEFQ